MGSLSNLIVNLFTLISFRKRFFNHNFSCNEKKLKKQIYSYDNLVYGIFDKIFNKVSYDMVDMVD